MVVIGIFIFTRDLRFTDNHALNELSKHVDKIIPLFIFDKAQIFKNSRNKHYFSQPAANFIINSVNKMTINTIFSENLSTFVKKSGATHIGYNEDFSPFAKKRAQKWRKMFPKITFITTNTDLFLCKHEKYYKVFGAFYKHCKRNVIVPHTAHALHNQIITKNLTRVNIKATKESINIPLSALLNMGFISVREHFKKTRDKNLFWRDFHLMMYISEKNAPLFKYIDVRFNRIGRKLKKFSTVEFRKFWACQTGFPMVDASMNQLLTTGFCPNRSRLMLCCFWCKYLRIPLFNKKYGAFYCFSRLLVDAIGCSQNLMNHHWVLDTDYGGRRFGRGISGRPFSLRTRSTDREYVAKWLPKNYNAKPIFDEKKRYREWVKACEKL